MPDPAALDARAASLRALAADVDDCADQAIARASSSRWSSPNSDDVRDRLRQARSRAQTAADALRAAAADATRAAQHERDRREQERRAAELREQQTAQRQPL